MATPEPTGSAEIHRLRQAVDAAAVDLIVIPDTNILIKNAEIRDWRPERRALVVLSDVVMGELDHLKARQDQPDVAQAAIRLHASLAEVVDSQSLHSGARINDQVSAIIVHFHARFALPGLNAKSPDHKIISLAGTISQHFSQIPCLLLTNDNNMAVTASGCDVNHFRHANPLSESARQRFEEAISRITPSAATAIDRLHENLPPRETIIISEFIGRHHQLNVLRQWLKGDRKKWALTGEGGKGKSAIAYQLASEVASCEVTSHIQAVCWMSAKRRRFVEGAVRPIVSPDFTTLEEALDFLLDFFKEIDTLDDIDEKKSRVLLHLNLYPTLIVVDDIDSIPDDQVGADDIYEFFTDEIMLTSSRVLFTSRTRLFGMSGRQTNVPGLDHESAVRYIRSKAEEFGIPYDRLEASTNRIVDVTEGSPLYIEDLLRLCTITNVSNAIHQWDRRRGDTAREYALEKEIEALTNQSRSDRDVLIACAECEERVSAKVLANLLDRRMEEIESALNHLRQFYLIPEPTEHEGILEFELMRNTRSLVRDRYGRTAVAVKVRGALTALGHRPHERGEVADIERDCLRARLMAQSGQYLDAESVLLALRDRFPNRPVPLQVLGWVYKRWEPSPRLVEARGLFQRSRQLGLCSEDLFRHWSELEEADGQLRSAISIAEEGVAAHGHSLGLLLRCAQAHLQLYRQLGSELGRDGSVAELDRTLELARMGGDVKSRDRLGQSLKSKLFECGAKAALRHPSSGPGRGLIELWERELPDDPWLPDYSSRLR